MESKPTVLTRIKDFFLFRTLQSKIVWLYLLFSIVLFLYMNLAVMSVVTRIEHNMMLMRLQSDINYMEDLISSDNSARWKIINDEIYFGNVLVGDGTQAKANLEPFFELEKKTGTFAYVFMIDKDADLSYVEETETAEGYQEGHYLRVAGSTKSPDGKSIVGTYITKNVADSLDEKGVYSGEANVAGGMIFCLYNALYNDQGEIVGAMVVGRNITEIKSQISNSARKIAYAIFFVMLVCGTFMLFLTSRWTSSIKVIADYLRQIEKGTIPDKMLSLNTKDEMGLIAEGVNRMVKSLEENNKLRKKSETDALTDLPNRSAFYTYTKEIYGKLLEKPQTFAVEILDIDFFKQYNDNYGHIAGDKCIQMVADEIYAISKANENVFPCRYGGDEFVIIYNGHSKEEIKDMVATLKGKVLSCQIEHEYSKISDVVTVTQGVCFGFFDGHNSIEEFFEKADSALYYVKKITRNDYNIVNIEDEFE